MITTFAVSDMHCAACVGKVESALGSVSGVERCRVNPVRRQVVVDHAGDLKSDVLISCLEQAGFQPALLSAGNDSSGDDRRLLARLGVAGLAMMQVMMVAIALYAGADSGMEAHYRRLLEYASLVFCIPVVSFSALPFFVSAYASVRRGPTHLNMDVPIALAIAVAFSASLVTTLTGGLIGGSGEVYYDSVVMFTFLMLGSRYIDNRLRNRLKVEDDRLASLPRQVLRLVAGQRIETPVSAIEAGDAIWIGEGELVPVDGVVSGRSRAVLDESMLTGEQQPLVRAAGDAAYAGTLNCGAGFELAVTSVGDGTRLAQIEQLANDLGASKHALAELADRVARVFVPAILIIASAVALFWLYHDSTRALSATLAVLVVSCPCALALATPAAVTAAMTRLRQAGILVKHSAALERIDQCDSVCVDKTGTLTLPGMQIVDVQLLNRDRGGLFSDESILLSLAAGLERHSSHPIANAFRHVPAAELAEVVSVPGAGLTGRYSGHELRLGSADFTDANAAVAHASDQGADVVLAIDGAPALRFLVGAALRPDARPTIGRLSALGLGVSIISGDSDARCSEVAEHLGIDYLAGCAPEEKVAATTRRRAMFVGDGINDVPALAGAAVSVATLETTDLVKSKADVVLLTSRLAALVDLVGISRSMRRVIGQNLAWAALYNVIAIPLAASGVAPPWMAAVGMAASSLLVLANAGRLLSVPLEQLAPEAS